MPGMRPPGVREGGGHQTGRKPLQHRVRRLRPLPRDELEPGIGEDTSGAGFQQGVEMSGQSDNLDWLAVDEPTSLSRARSLRAVYCGRLCSVRRLAVRFPGIEIRGPHDMSARALDAHA